MDSTFSPRVTGSQRADFYSLGTFLEYQAFKGKRGEALVMAIYEYLTSTVDGTYHFWPSGECEGSPKLRRTVMDALKLWNAYGWAICGQTAMALHELYRAAGLRSRVYGAPGHTLCEVFYDGGWHAYDVDMWTWFKTSEGRVASAYELCTNAKALIVDNENTSAPCNLPDRDLGQYAQMYETYETKDGEQSNIWPDWHIAAHTMDFHLRPGETLVRSQANDGRFHMPQEWKTNAEVRYPFEWHGEPRERYEPFRTFGNGRWIYEPNLAAGFADFEEGVWENSDLAQDADGLVGPGRAAFRIRSPYPFCGIPNWQGETISHSDGVMLGLRGDGNVNVEVSSPEGEWATVLSATGSFDEKVDITDSMSSRYDCMVRLELAAGARVDRFRFDGYIMTAPCSIPRLVEGDNPMQLRCADKHGLLTTPWSRTIDFRSGADLGAQGLALENAAAGPRPDDIPWQLIIPQSGLPARVVLRFDAPEGHPFAWFYFHSQHREAPADASSTRAALEWSADQIAWLEFASGMISNSPLIWDVAVDGEVRPPAALDTVFVRVCGETPISGLEFHGHITEEPHDGRSPEIVHSWEEGDETREYQVPPGTHSYSVRCGPNPHTHTIAMRVLSIPLPPGDI